MTKRQSPSRHTPEKGLPFLFLLYSKSIVVLFALRNGERKSLPCHFVAFQILIVGSDLVDQLAADDLHDAVGRGLDDLVVTGGENHDAGEFLHAVV